MSGMSGMSVMSRERLQRPLAARERREGATSHPDDYATFWNLAAGAPQMGHFSGALPNSMSPQNGHR